LNPSIVNCLAFKLEEKLAIVPFKAPVTVPLKGNNQTTLSYISTPASNRFVDGADFMNDVAVVAPSLFTLNV
jgi:hypothetical protein